SPFIPGSGEPGGTGRYGLLVAAAPLASPVAGPGPAVIAATPHDGAALNDAPFAVRLALSAPLDPATILPGVNVLLTDADGNPVAINGAVFNLPANELQVFPAAPLAPGTYHLLLAGQDATLSGVPAITGVNGEALGSTTHGGPG